MGESRVLLLSLCARSAHQPKIDKEVEKREVPARVPVDTVQDTPHTLHTQPFPPHRYREGILFSLRMLPSAATRVSRTLVRRGRRTFSDAAGSLMPKKQGLYDPALEKDSCGTYVSRLTVGMSFRPDGGRCLCSSHSRALDTPRQCRHRRPFHPPFAHAADLVQVSVLLLTSRASKRTRL